MDIQASLASFHATEIPWENGLEPITPEPTSATSQLFADVMDSTTTSHVSVLDGCVLGLQQEKNKQNLYDWIQNGGDRPISYRQDIWDFVSTVMLWESHCILDFRNSRFIPDILDDAFLVNAGILDATRTQSSSLPDSFHASNLYTLILDNSAISKLPDDTSNAWTQLSELHINGCRDLPLSSVISLTFLRSSCEIWFQNTVFADLLPEDLRYNLQGQPISKLLQSQEMLDLLAIHDLPHVFK